MSETFCCDFCEREFPAGSGHLELLMIFPEGSNEKPNVSRFCRGECLVAAAAMWVADTATDEDDEADEAAETELAPVSPKN